MATMTTTTDSLILLQLAVVLVLLHAGTGSAANVPPPAGQPNGTVQHQTGNETSLSLLLSRIASNAPPTGFYMAAAGAGPGQLFALGLCRADLAADRCRGCLDAARSGVLLNSAVATGLTVWQNYECFMRYSTGQSFFGEPDLRGSSTCSRKGTPQEAEDYEAAIRLVTRLVGLAPTRPLLFAAGQQSSSYALVQCSRDLSSDGCGACLSRGIDDLASTCRQYGGGRYISSSCIVEYEDAPFFNTSTAGVVFPDPSPAPAPAPNNDGNNVNGSHRSGLTGLVWFFLLVINLLKS